MLFSSKRPWRFVKPSRKEKCSHNSDSCVSWSKACSCWINGVHMNLDVFKFEVYFLASYLRDLEMEVTKIGEDVFGTVPPATSQTPKSKEIHRNDDRMDAIFHIKLWSKPQKGGSKWRSPRSGRHFPSKKLMWQVTFHQKGAFMRGCEQRRKF